jgi:hypothetical protein
LIVSAVEWILGLFKGSGNQAVAPPQKVIQVNSGQGNAYQDLGVGSNPLYVVDGYYFRIVPTIAGQLAGAASNTVHIRWNVENPSDAAIAQGVKCAQDPTAPGCPTPLSAGPKAYTLEIISYHGIVSPTHQQGCYVVVEGGLGFKDGFPKKYNAGELICPPKPSAKGWLESVVDFVTDAVNWVSSAYSDLKNTVVSFVANFVPSSLCDKSCLGTLLDAGLAAMGIPPSLPNFDQLVNEGLDYLAAEAVAQLGIPQEVYDQIPEGLSEDLMKQAIQDAEKEWKEKAAEELKKGIQQGLKAAQYAYADQVSWLPKGIALKPDPLGDYQMPSLTLRLTRNPVVKEVSPACLNTKILIMSEVTNDLTSSSAQYFNDHVSSGPKLVPGQTYNLYDLEHIPFIDLNPGEHFDIPVVLRPSFYSYWGAPSGWTSFNDARDAWAALYQGGSADIFAFHNCAGSDGLLWDAAGSYPQ